MTAEKIYIQDEINNAKFNKFHVLIAIIVSSMTLFDGYDTFNPAYVIHYVMGPWGLKPASAGLLVSSGLIGFLFGAAGHGVIADRIGRRKTLIGGFFIACVFTLATALFAKSFESFCTLRFITGLGLGVLLPLGTTYINELAPKRIANVFTLWGVALGWALGGTLAGIVGAFATPIWGWESIYYIGSAFFLILIPLYLYLPESLRFLETTDRHDEIKTLLIRLRPERKEIYSRAVAFEKPKNISSKGSISALLSPQYRRTTLSIWSTAFLILFCIFGLTAWIPNVMLSRGETFSRSFEFGALLQIGSFVGGLACGWIGDKRGSTRLALSAWWFMGSASIFLLAFFDDHIVNLLGVIAAGVFVIGGQFVLNNATSASYDTGIRATGVGMELAIGRIGAILGPFVAGLLQQIFGGSFAMFIAIGIASCLAAIIIGSSKLPSYRERV